MNQPNVIVKSNAQQVGITNPFCCIINNLAIHSTTLLDSKISELLSLLNNDPQSIYQTQCYIGFKEFFARLGYPNQVTSCDRLINYYIKNGFKSINNIVDSYNICSVLFGSPIGLHDANKINGDIVIQRSDGLLKIKPMFKNSIQTIKKGDIVYSNNNEAMCWMGKNDLDSDEFKITGKTTAVFIMAIGNHRSSADFNKEICMNIYSLILLSCPQAILKEVPIILE